MVSWSETLIYKLHALQWVLLGQLLSGFFKSSRVWCSAKDVKRKATSFYVSFCLALHLQIVIVIVIDEVSFSLVKHKLI